MTPIERIQKLSSVLTYLCAMVGASVLLLLLGHLALVAAYSAVEAIGLTSLVDDPRSESPAYAHFPEAKAYWREFERAGSQRFDWRFSGRCPVPARSSPDRRSCCRPR